MSPPPDRALAGAFRAAGGRVTAALAARFGDLGMAEDAFAEACARAALAWPKSGVPADPAAWLYRAAQRAALDELRKRRVRSRHDPDPPEPQPSAEDAMTSDAAVIPDERLRLIFVCCHPAIAADTRVALTLKLVCGLSTEETARAFLLPETTLAQRLVRAKRKIAAAGIRFEVPGPQAWPERLESVLVTVEVAYAKAHEDGAGAGRHAGLAGEMISVSAFLADHMPDEPDVLALAATIRFAEARRRARVDNTGCMMPLAEQDPAQWDRRLIGEADRLLRRAVDLGRATPRLIQAAIHRSWCLRNSLEEPPPWPAILRLYDELLELRDDLVVRLNRLVPLAEVRGAAAALREFDELEPSPAARAFLPYQVVRADLLRRCGRAAEAAGAYRDALALAPGAAEHCWLERQLREVEAGAAGATRD